MPVKVVRPKRRALTVVELIYRTNGKLPPLQKQGHSNFSHRAADSACTAEFQIDLFTEAYKTMGFYTGCLQTWWYPTSCQQIGNQLWRNSYWSAEPYCLASINVIFMFLSADQKLFPDSYLTCWVHAISTGKIPLVSFLNLFSLNPNYFLLPSSLPWFYSSLSYTRG